MSDIQESHWELKGENASCPSSYLWPRIERILRGRAWPDARAFDLGCGNGSTGDALSRLGFSVTGADPSASGIALARATYPRLQFHVGNAYENLAGRFGTFPLVVSLEVIEHCIDPRQFLKSFLGLMAPGGMGIISTPYHGYWKNLALAVTGKMDQHFTVLWPVGHIKFFSIRTLAALLEEHGVADTTFYRVGRVPAFAKSIVAVIRR